MMSDDQGLTMDDLIRIEREGEQARMRAYTVDPSLTYVFKDEGSWLPHYAAVAAFLAHLAADNSAWLPDLRKVRRQWRRAIIEEEEWRTRYK